MSGNKSMKRWGILGLLIVILGGYGFLWNKASNRAEELVQNYLTLTKRDPRMTVSYKDLSMGGFPLSVKAALDKLRFDGDLKEGKISISFEKEVTFQMKLWDWETLHAFDEGGSLSGNIVGLSAFKASWDKSAGWIKFDSEGEVQAACGEIADIKIGDEKDSVVKKISYNFEDKGIDDKDATMRSVNFEVDVKTGKIMDREIEATLKGEYAIPETWVKGLRENPGKLLGEPDKILAFLKSAYAKSEVFDIRSLSFEMDGVTVVLKGTLSLDEKLQPLASWTFEVVGLNDMKKGSIFSGVLFMAPMMGFNISETGGIKLSGTIQDQEVTINGQVMAQLPLIDWKQALPLMKSGVPALPIQGG